ncbi:extracellular solute-binding protein [Bacillus sp. FJAT-50079]|uniref:extracellular solute-binding protein n=1 Tax=Bacillus sp. FJAT-50079 TaxID=2833577 RepID=UPI001BC97620|nr:extracellular solute-binding protein [Bacillus sp. FJAT-50079]MBS4210025.1 extracellular solute-binding protein [Bacillus sp. FJAT-50079]
MNKKLVLTIISILCFSILVACNGGKNSTGGSTESSGGKSGGEEKKLTLWHIETGNNVTVLENAVKRFEDKHEGVSVEVVQVENDPYKTNLVVAMGGGNPPDVFHSWGGGWLKQFSDAGQVLELTDKIDADNYIPAAISPATFDEKVFGAPLALSGVPVYYNKDIFEKYNLTPPTTYDELLTIIDTLNENKVIPFAIANQSKWPGAFYLMYFADRLAGNELFNNAFGREGRGFDDPVYVKAGEMIQELVEKKAFPNGFNGLNYDTGQSRQLIYSEQAAMILQTTGFINNLRSEAPKDFEKKIDIFNFPAIEGGKGDPTNVVGGVSPVFSVAAKSANPDLAVELVKELTSLETAQDATDNGGKIPAVKGVEIKDEFIQKVNDLLSNANSMQTFYDQTLPPELGELHKDTTQAIFGLEMTPQEAADAMEKKAKEILK